MNYSGIIEDWQINNLSTGGQILTGYVVQDFKGRWKVGWHMRSSLIKKVENDVVYTNNSTYLLKGESTGQDLGDFAARIFY